jgi:hypothetical protein
MLSLTIGTVAGLVLPNGAGVTVAGVQITATTAIGGKYDGPVSV